MIKNEKYQDIFLASHELFRSQGYENTTIRQISERANVSLGLTNHFFHSKTELAGYVLDMLSSYTRSCCDRISPCFDDPLLRTTLYTTVNTLYMINGKYRRFYVDCLKYDLFFRMLEKAPNITLYQLAGSHGFPVNDDLFLLYGKYVPYNYEKTLILNKESGMFPTISYEDVPDYIIISKFEHFLERSILDEALAKAHGLSGRILEDMDGIVPDTFVNGYICSRIK